MKNVAKSSWSNDFDDFTQSHLEEIRDAFNIFDRDGDGRITTDELSTVMASLGQRPTKSELKNMISEFDEDGFLFYLFLPLAYLCIQFSYSFFLFFIAFIFHCSFRCHAFLYVCIA